jgi:hypothetical protein
MGGILMANELPPIPEGFELESPATGSQGSLPPIPEGFEVEEEGPLTTARREAVGVLRGMREGLPFAKDISAATYAAQSALQGRGWDYAKERERVSRQQKAASEATPLAYTAGEIGSFFTPLGLPGKAPSLANLALRGEQAVAKKLAPKIGETAAKIAGAGTAGAGLGALQGAGEGADLSSRLENIEAGAIGGGALGAVLPAAGKVLGLAPTAAEKAAAKLGISVPRYVASESKLARPFYSAIGSLPFAKSIVESGVNRGIGRLEEAASKIVPSSVGESQALAGKGAKQSLVDWVDVESRNDLNARYKHLNKLLDPDARTTLSGTAATWQKLNLPAKPSITNQLQNRILAAINNPNGVTYEEAKYLRKVVGSGLKGKITQSDLPQQELNLLYGSLTNDLEKIVRNSAESKAVKAGLYPSQVSQMGNKALTRYAIAEGKANNIINTRKRLGEIIGLGGDASDQKVFSRLSAIAKDSSTGNEELLRDAKRTMSPQSWNDITAGIISNFGDVQGKFDPQTFAKKFYEMSDVSKDILFGKSGTAVRDSIESVNLLAKQYAEEGKTKNLSNTVTALGLIAAPPAIWGMLTGGPTGALEKEGEVAAVAIPIAFALAYPRLSPKIVAAIKNPSKEAVSNLRNAVISVARQRLTTPSIIDHGPLPVMAEDREQREQRASGGAVGKRDYPAKRLTRMERAVKRAQDAIALETKPLMDQPDHLIAHALELSKATSL